MKALNFFWTTLKWFFFNVEPSEWPLFCIQCHFLDTLTDITQICINYWLCPLPLEIHPDYRVHTPLEMSGAKGGTPHLVSDVCNSYLQSGAPWYWLLPSVDMTTVKFLSPLWEIKAYRFQLFPKPHLFTTNCIKSELNLQKSVAS